MSAANTTPAAWQESRCNVPMWMGGAPAGFCGQIAHGHQLPSQYLHATRVTANEPYCHGHACPMHGGPRADEVRIFQDGLTPEGRPMWCAVLPDFVDLYKSPAGFDGDPCVAVQKLHAAVAKATGAAS